MTLSFVASAIATSEQDSEKIHRLLVTGYSHQRRHTVMVDGTHVSLTGTCFLALVDLLVARLTTYSGYTPVPSCLLGRDGTRLVIHRLRKALFGALPETELITCDGKTRYRLRVAPCCLGVDPSFFKLPVPDFVSPETMSVLRREAQQARP